MRPLRIALFPDSVQVGDSLLAAPVPVDRFIASVGTGYLIYERCRRGDTFRYYVWSDLGIVAKAQIKDGDTLIESPYIVNFDVWFEPCDVKDMGGPDDIIVRPRTEPITVGSISVGRSTTLDFVRNNLREYDWQPGCIWWHDGLGDNSLESRDDRLRSPHWRLQDWDTAFKPLGNLPPNKIGIAYFDSLYRGQKLGYGLSWVSYEFGIIDPLRYEIVADDNYSSSITTSGWAIFNPLAWRYLLFRTLKIADGNLTINTGPFQGSQVIRLSRVAAIDILPSVVGGMFNFGTLSLRIGGEQRPITIPFVKEPETVRECLLNFNKS